MSVDISLSGYKELINYLSKNIEDIKTTLENDRNRIGNELGSIYNRVTDLNVKIEVMRNEIKHKAKFWGAIAGAIPPLIFTIVILILKLATKVSFFGC